MQTDKKQAGCYQYCLTRLNRKAYTSTEIRRILVEKNYPENEINEAITRCTEFNFLNDTNYTNSYIYEKQMIKKWGKLKIINELSKRGIVNIPDMSFDSAIEEQNIKKHLKSKCDKIQHKELNKHTIKQQVYRYLYFKGFEPEMIQQSIKNAGLD